MQHNAKVTLNIESWLQVNLADAPSGGVFGLLTSGGSFRIDKSSDEPLKRLKNFTWDDGTISQACLSNVPKNELDP